LFCGYNFFKSQFSHHHWGIPGMRLAGRQS